MGAIYGIYNVSSQKIVEKDTLKRIDEIMASRGIETGIYLDKNFGFGSRRLCIIDSKTGSQPVSNEDKTVFVICDGEIYNYIELRESLEKKGHKFYTSSDTEVLVHLYEEFGENGFLNEVNGMFGLAIWDSKERKLLLARDRLGAKPLFYLEANDRLIFASLSKAIMGIKGLKKEINFEGIHHFLTHSYIPSPQTAFVGVKKIPPAHILKYKEGNLSINQYWSYSQIEEDYTRGEEFFKERIFELLTDSIRIRLRSDVPIGTLLSGGIDTSIIVAIISKVLGQSIKTFTIKFEDEYHDESKYAQIVADYFGTEHHVYFLKPLDAIEIFPKLINALDQPNSDDAAISIYKISEVAKGSVKGIFCGEAADELFCGVGDYVAEQKLSRYALIPQLLGRKLVYCMGYLFPSQNRFLGKVGRTLQRISLPPIERAISWNVTFDNESKCSLYSPELRESLKNFDPFEIKRHYFNQTKCNDYINKRLYLDQKMWLPEGLQDKNELMSMAHSIETRSPYFDYRLVELTATIPTKLKLNIDLKNEFSRKYILKKTFSNILPDIIMKKVKLHGFTTPTNPWFKGDLKNFANEILFDTKTIKRGYFNQQYVTNLLKEHQKGIRDNRHRIFTLLILELWLREYLDK